MVCVLAALLFIIRLVVAPFSPKLSEQMRKHPVVHIIWGCFAFVGVLVFLGVLSPTMWPPISVERHQQRAEVLERVQTAGGWDAIRQGCIALARQNTNGFVSDYRHTNGWPAAIAALNPIFIEYEPAFGCMSIRIFGIPRTEGHSEPYFGLEVDTSTNSVSFNHGTGYDNGNVFGNHHSVAEKVSEGIYEIY